MDSSHARMELPDFRRGKSEKARLKAWGEVEGALSVAARGLGSKRVGEIVLGEEGDRQVGEFLIHRYYRNWESRKGQECLWLWGPSVWVGGGD